MSRYVIAGPSSFALRGQARQAAWASGDTDSRGHRPRRRRGMLALAALLLALAAWQLGGAAWIHAKAIVAQHLIASSWQRAGEGGAQPPWPWADTRPVARLAVPSRGIALYVLEGASGRSLAFGPGHVPGTAPPGSDGNSVIVAHRDTHFAFLRDLRADDEITVEVAGGRMARYRVREAIVVDKGATRLLEDAGSPQLTLVTCWPFDAIRPGTAQRYAVIAERA